MLESRVFRSIAEIDRDAWDACFRGALETYDYLLATERASLAGFAPRYATTVRAGKLLAAAPAFMTDYALDTTLTGAGGRIARSLRRMLPGALTLRLGAIGSPCTETATLGFCGTVADEDKPAILNALVRGFESEALRDGCGLLAVKDAEACNRTLWDGSLDALRYRAVAGLPVAVLDIEFDTIDGYLQGLSAGARRDMRRKLRKIGDLRIERRTDIRDVIDRVQALYAETRARADMQFEDLTPAYFENVLALMPERALCMLYFVGDELIGFNLLIHDDVTLLDKFFCMNAERGRAYSLYFLSWFTNIRLCLERGLKRYQSGQAGYDSKLRLGCRLEPTAMYFRHRNALLSRALQMVAPLFVSDPAFGGPAT